MKPVLWISEREPLIPEKEMQKFLGERKRIWIGIVDSVTEETQTYKSLSSSLRGLRGSSEHLCNVACANMVGYTIINSLRGNGMAG